MTAQKKFTTYCNPLDLGYKFQHFMGEKPVTNREGADPTLVLFKGTYYLFVSMSAGFWHSDDLTNWEFYRDENLQIYDYAPDARQVGNYLYFCASKATDSPIFRTRDPLHEPFEKVSAPFPFWDPDIFADDDGRVYIYWGCSNAAPIYGMELDGKTFLPIGEKKELIFNSKDKCGFERTGDDNKTGADPWIEGAYMTKYNGKYYLQYACPGTEFNTYANGVYVGDHPLGPFVLQKSNPFSSKPGGFITGAGHGSTVSDKFGNWWHAATMRISVSHMFERRVGLFPAGFDKDEILFCNQNFADYPHEIPQKPFKSANTEPKWMLLSYKKPGFASSTAEGSFVELAFNEDVRSWWSAENSSPGEWLSVDLEKIMDIHAIQVNFADDLGIAKPEKSYVSGRNIELSPQITEYTLETSPDGKIWTVADEISRECAHGYSEFPDGIKARYVRVTGVKMPFNEPMRISGLRIFGFGDGSKPAKTTSNATRTGNLDALVSWNKVPSAMGYNIRYGIAPDKLYLSKLVYEDQSTELTSLISGQEYWVCVDAFNENGITNGDTVKIK